MALSLSQQQPTMSSSLPRQGTSSGVSAHLTRPVQGMTDLCCHRYHWRPMQREALPIYTDDSEEEDGLEEEDHMILYYEVKRCFVNLK